MNKKFLRSFVHDLFIDISGGLLVAIGIQSFAVAASFPMTGVTGISLILFRVFGTPIGTMTMLLNIPIALACYRILGRQFFIRSLKTILTFSIILDYIAPLFPVYTGERILAALCTGIFTGLGYAIAYMNNSSTGGIDFINLSIRAKKPHITLGKIAFALDATIVFIGGMIFSDIDGIIYGLIVSFLLSSVIDKLMYGIDAGKMTLIITDKGEEIAQMIYNISGRGATFLQGTGSYSMKNKSVVMCACNNKQMFLIKQAAKEVDPYAFTIIMESNEVVGEGFKPL